MMALIYSSTSGVIIGVVVNVAAVAIYDLASRLSRSIRAFAYYSTAAMLPAMSSLEARRGSQAIHRALIDGSRYVSAVSFCVCGFVIASAPIIFSAWLGSRAPQRALLDEVLIVLCLSAVIDNYVNVSTTVLRAIGAPKLETLYTVATAIVSICIAISLAPRFGVIGVVLGPLVGSTVGSTLFMIAFSRTRNLPLMSNFGKPLLKIIAVTTVSASLTYVVVQPLLQNGPPSRPLAFVEIIIVGSLYLAIFTIMLGITKYLGDHDLAFVKRILPKRLALAIDPRLIRFLFVRTIP
jgi:O-antigen/teichoic acid export membrane protein